MPRPSNALLDASPRLRRRRAVAALAVGLALVAAGACSGSTAPEPGEHKTKHEEATEVPRPTATLRLGADPVPTGTPGVTPTRPAPPRPTP